jgi:hypothetical protein
MKEVPGPFNLNVVNCYGEVHFGIILWSMGFDITYV